MLKILYAANNHHNSKFVLERFFTQCLDKPYIIKIAAYKKSTPDSISVDWTLDCLFNMFNPRHISINNNDNFEIYLSQIKSYNPDLIISDLEYFTSIAAIDLNIPVWQCSSNLINFALNQQTKYNLGIFKKYSYLISKRSEESQRLTNIIENSNRNLIYSHFGDTIDPVTINDNFEWVKPYYKIGKKSIVASHNIVSYFHPNLNKKMAGIIGSYSDCVAFSDFVDERYNNIVLKKYSDNSEEYANNLKNSNLFLCNGQTTFLADAYYNGKFSAIHLDLTDTECIINSMISDKQGLSDSNIYCSADLEKHFHIEIFPHQNNIKHLHEKIEEF